MDTTARIAELQARLRWMNENLEGCDWCCGGGDEEAASIVAELGELEDMTTDKGDAE